MKRAIKLITANIVVLLVWSVGLSGNVHGNNGKQLFWAEDIPVEMVSFGACEADGYLYLHGGHKGKAHTYSKEHHENVFLRAKIKPRGGWEKLQPGSPAQGYAMVSYKGQILKVGGSQATNEPDEDHNLHSLDLIELYDPKKNKWSVRGMLPEPRSSHEAVVIGDKLYVVGGWDFGNGREAWLGCISADLTEKELKWTTLPEMPIDRRAFSIAHDDRYIYLVGGMDDQGTLNDFDFYDTKNKEWARGPKVPTKGGLKAFGSAAGYLEGNVYASDAGDVLHRYDLADEKWHEAGKLNAARFFHRIVCYSGDVFVIGGTSRKTGAVHSIEKISVEKNSPRVGVLDGAHWPGFRGDGSSLTAAKNLPTKWADKDVKWAQNVEGYGQSSPVVFNGRVFVTSVIGDNKESLGVHCYDLKTGQNAWSKIVENSNHQKITDYISKGAPTPCVDENGVYCFFETGQLLAIGHDGEIQWQRSLTKEYGDFQGNHGVGTSLVQSSDHLVLLIDHSADGYLLKLSKKTGENSWKIDREKRVSWSTPVIDATVSPNQIVISSNGIVEGVSFKNGRQLWSYLGVEKNTIPSATVTRDLILVGSSVKPSSIALPRDKAGSITKDQVSWTAENATSSMSSPLVVGENVYYVSRAGVLSCNDLKTGKQLWDHRLPASCWATPVGAGDAIYYFCKEGSTVVMKNERSGPVELAKSKLDIEGPVYGVAVVDGAIVMRTGSQVVALLN